MKELPIDYIKIKGFRSIKDADIKFGSINILLGANGSGKSNFLEIFNLINAAASDTLDEYVKKCGGADQLFRYGISTTDKITVESKICGIDFSCVLVPGDDNRVKEESSKGKEELRKSGMMLTVYHFHNSGVSSALKKSSDLDDCRYLKADGSNFASRLYSIKNTAPENYDKIEAVISIVYTEFKKFIFSIDEKTKQVSLRWIDKCSKDYTHPIKELSDGTIRFAVIASLLLQPDPPSFIIIDEPELGLHPFAINVLSDMLSLASIKSSILISTQSVQLVNRFSPDDIIITENRLGQTEIKRLSGSDLEEWLEDYSLGDIWQMNIIGGNP
ncbi:MAG TPA: AAA family ATPase [Methanocorpusculum sp.]|nr:AAA family ATPase [Methanocorpusculum sp.]